jgi:hypothetical protein
VFQKTVNRAKEYACQCHIPEEISLLLSLVLQYLHGKFAVTPMNVETSQLLQPDWCRCSWISAAQISLGSKMLPEMLSMPHALHMQHGLVIMQDVVSSQNRYHYCGCSSRCLMLFSSRATSCLTMAILKPDVALTSSGQTDPYSIHPYQTASFTLLLLEDYLQHIPADQFLT